MLGHTVWGGLYHVFWKVLIECFGSQHRLFQTKRLAVGWQTLSWSGERWRWDRLRLDFAGFKHYAAFRAAST